jgi:hypothetical protein
MLAQRARIFTVVFWIAIVLLGVAVLALIPSLTTLLSLFGTTALAALSWVLAYTALQQQAAAAWYRDTFDSDPVLALRTVDVEYLAQIIGASPKRPGVAALRHDPDAVRPFAARDAAAHFESIDHGAFFRRLERLFRLKGAPLHQQVVATNAWEAVAVVRRAANQPSN